jgi:hypothetical protein
MIGANFTASSPNAKHRKYQSSAEYQAAIRTHFGAGATQIFNIRLMIQAARRLNRAVIGRTLINAIKEAGKNADVPTVIEGVESPGPGYFHLDHPAFKRWKLDFVTVPDDISGSARISRGRCAPS